jgi:hypothetical protein
VDDGRIQRGGKTHDFGVRACTAAPTEQSDFVVLSQQLGETLEIGIGWPDPGPALKDGVGERGDIGHRVCTYVARNYDDRDSAFRNGCLDCDLENARNLFGRQNGFAVVAAFLEEPVGMSFLEVSGADFGAGDMSGYGEDGSAGSVAVEQTVNQV